MKLIWPMSLWDRGLRALALAMLVVYVGWQLWWISSGQVPPALFLALTGWPAPTTGGTRSFAALMEGDWRRSLFFNAMTIPILSVLLVTLLCLAHQAGTRKQLGLPRALVYAWVGILTIAWLIKLAQAFCGAV